jgi:hypothetical protein
MTMAIVAIDAPAMAVAFMRTFTMGWPALFGTSREQAAKQ